MHFHFKLKAAISFILYILHLYSQLQDYEHP